MAYATSTDLLNDLGEREYERVADRDGSGEVDEAAVTLALDNASSMVDSYLARWLPLSEVPAVLKRHVMAIAVYDLAGNSQTDDQRRRYEDAVAWLRDVASGRASIGIPPTDSSSAEGAVLSFTTPRALTRSTMRGIL